MVELLAEDIVVESGHRCDQCGKLFSVVSNLRRHQRRLHTSGGAGGGAVVKRVRCQLCEYQCRDKHQLRVHTR